MHIAFDRYYDFDEMTAHLHALAAAYPRLATLTSIAQSHRGRDVWFMQITNPDTGPALEKPGYYIDAQIHAEEHATSATALYAIHYLLTRYGTDPEVTRLVDGQVFYIIPRINPDGAEYALKAPYHPWCGNGRVLPGEDRLEGLQAQDIDGDGYIVNMRVPDPKGEWKKDPGEPRLMIQREPGEEGGDYFRIFPEGLIPDYDGADVKILPVRLAELANRVALYKALGEVGTRLTGYPVISTYEDFTPDKSKVRHGSLKDWVYEEMGIICFSTELWDIEIAAGVEKKGYYNLRPRNAEVQRKLFDWVIANVGDNGFREWRAFDHPQLGPVEVGGMVYIWSYRNPPGKLLEKVCHDNTLFNLRHAAAAPRVIVDSVTVAALGNDLHKVTAIVANHGYLPTNLSDVAVKNKVAKTVTVTIEGAEVVINPPTVDLGHLAGRNERNYEYSNWGQQWSPVARKVEWLVRGTGSVTVTARSEKGGTHRCVSPL